MESIGLESVVTVHRLFLCLEMGFDMGRGFGSNFIYPHSAKHKSVDISFVFFSSFSPSFSFVLFFFCLSSVISLFHAFRAVLWAVCSWFNALFLHIFYQKKFGTIFKFFLLLSMRQFKWKWTVPPILFLFVLLMVHKNTIFWFISTLKICCLYQFQF